MLNGIRILDMSRVLAGPLCSMILADLGADVIKVERPGTGDETRGWGPPFDARGESAYFLSVNRNKLSVSADLNVPADVALLERLMSEADVVVDNFLPGTLDRHGLAPDALATRYPRIVWCTITGFGAGSERPGYDFVIQAETGWMAITGDPAGDPMKVGVALVDVVAGKDAAIAILGALLARERTGAGRRVPISLAASATAALVNAAQNALVTGEEQRRWGNAHPNLVPYQLFRAADRGVVVAVGSDAQWVACAGALDLRDLAGAGELATNAGRVAQRARVTQAIAARIAEHPASYWQRVLSEVGVPCGVVRSVLEVLAEATAASPLYGLPSSVGGVVRRPPPRLNEHGARVRAEGWGAFG